MDKLKDWFFEEGEDVADDEAVDTVVEETEPKTSLFEKARSKKTSNVIDNTDGQLVLFEPRSFKESQDIADYLKLKKAAVVNLHRLQKDTAIRVIDFLCGVSYAIEGVVQKIAPKTYLCTPKNIGVSGQITLSDDDVDLDEE